MSGYTSLGNLFLDQHMESRSINAENPTGEKGRGGMAASGLGPSRKGAPCLHDIPSGARVNLAAIEGPGIIRHIWITVPYKTTDADCFVLRDLVLRFYWDDETLPHGQFSADRGGAEPGAELLFPDAVQEECPD